MSTEQKHTPEPWREVINCTDDYNAHPVLIYAGAQYVAQVAFDQNEGDETDANARRIVACVNACAGINTDALERIADGEMLSGLIRLRTYKVQRDQMIDALRRMLATQHLPNPHPDRIAACSHARQLLAKVAR